MMDFFSLSEFVVIKKIARKIIKDGSYVRNIGLSGKIGAGKTTTIRCLENIFGEKYLGEFNSANVLKEGCKIMFGLSDDNVYGSSKETVIEQFNSTPRKILQEVGTACRSIYHDVFIFASLEAMKESSKSIRILGDIRYPNELAFFTSLPESISIKLKRCSGITSDHESEINVDRCITDHIIDNNTDIKTLIKEVLLLILKDSPEKQDILSFFI